MKKSTLNIVLFILISSSLYSQKNADVFNAEGENAIFKKEWSIGFRFHTNALSGYFEHVWIKDIKKRKLIQVNLFGLLDIRDKKNRTIIPAFSQDTRYTKYFYGKINDFYSVQLMYGYRTVIANKSEVSGVKLSFTYMGGITLGALMPYYIKVANIVNDKIELTDIRYLEETKNDFLNKNKIVGESDLFKGFSKMSFAPGVTAKLGLNFDFARKNNLVTSIEVGSQIDVFYKKINIYLNDTNKPYILNLYLSFQLGKRS